MLGEGVTDIEGIAIVTGARQMDILVAVVQLDGNFVYIPDVNIGHVRQHSFEDSIVLDRALVRPGETLHIKGQYSQLKDFISMKPSRIRQAKGGKGFG